MAKIEKILESAKKYLESDEKVVCAIMGAYDSKEFKSELLKSAGLFIATDKRLVFYGPKAFGNFEMEVFPYSNISSIEMSKELFMGHTIKFFASGNEVSMTWIKQGDVQGFVNEVKSMMGKKVEAATAVGGIDIPEQIKKLADLKAAGILTEDEFENKKRDLLAKL